MPDREKVIDELVEHIESALAVDSDYVDCVRTDLLQYTVALLKEQEEKTGEWIYKHDDLWYCSRYGEIIYSETDDDLEIHHAYCSRCGAKMKQEGR